MPLAVQNQPSSSLLLQIIRPTLTLLALINGALIGFIAPFFVFLAFFGIFLLSDTSGAGKILAVPVILTIGGAILSAGLLGFLAAKWMYTATAELLTPQKRPLVIGLALVLAVMPLLILSFVISIPTIQREGELDRRQVDEYAVWLDSFPRITQVKFDYHPASDQFTITSLVEKIPTRPRQYEYWLILDKGLQKNSSWVSAQEVTFGGQSTSLPVITVTGKELKNAYWRTNSQTPEPLRKSLVFSAILIPLEYVPPGNKETAEYNAELNAWIGPIPIELTTR